MARPLVSIAIPTWNRRDLLRTTLASARAQTYEPFEIVVSDNASDDGTVEMVRELAKEDDRIRLFVNDTNIGGMNYLAALKRCRGDYIKFLNSDDLISPGTVEQLAAALDDPQVGLAIARQDWMDEQGRPFSRSLAPPIVAWWRTVTDLGRNRVVSGFDLGNFCLRATVNAFGLPSSQMFRRSDVDFRTIGMLGGRRYQVLGDIACSLQLAAGRKVAYVADSTVWIRIHDGAESSLPTTNATGAVDWLDLIMSAPDLGYLANKAERLLALRKAALDLSYLPEDGNASTSHLVGDSIIRASAAIAELCETSMPLMPRERRLVVEPDWTSTPPLRNLLRQWAAQAHTLDQDELVLIVDPNMFSLETVVERVGTLLAELGLNPDEIPDITIEASVPALV